MNRQRCDRCMHWEKRNDPPHEMVGYCRFTDQDWDEDDYCSYWQEKTMLGTSNLMSVKVVLDPGAKMPQRAHEQDAGLDLFMPEIVGEETLAVFPGSSVTIDTGVHVEIPEGYVGLLKSKSGLNVRSNLMGEGVIDAGYTGSIVCKLYNFGRERHVFKEGDKIIQLLIVRCETPDVKLVSELRETERGNGGFGSTGR